MALKLTVVGDEEIARKFGNTAYRTALMQQTMEAELGLLHGSVVPLTPVGVTSLLRGSWHSENLTTATRYLGILGNPLIYARVIERGRTPGKPPPPVAAITSWVMAKLGPGASPYVVARAIGRKGIKGRRMLQKAKEQTLPLRQGLRDAMMRNIVAGG